MGPLKRIIRLVWRVGSGVVRGVLLCLAFLSFLRSLLRAPSYVRERHEGRKRLEGARKVLVFVHFDRSGTVHDFVLNHVRLLANCGFAVVFVSNAPTLAERAIEALKPICALILRRDNVGYDFGAYKEGIAAIPDLSALDQLALANDSVYGPFHHPMSYLERMSAETADVWGTSDSWEFSFHLQSYFLLFHRAALASPAFAAFWARMRFVQSKFWIVRHHEVGLTRALAGSGLRCRAAFPYREAASALIESVMERGVAPDSMDPVRKEFLARLFGSIDAGVPLNGTHFFWDHMIANMGFPFLKRDLLQKNPARIPLLTYWERIVRQSSDYDTDLILRHLERSLKNRSV